MKQSAFHWRGTTVAPTQGTRRTGLWLESFTAQVHAMRDRGMLQAEIARELGVTKRYVQKLLQRERKQ